jgi:hypothetical protein
VVIMGKTTAEKIAELMYKPENIRNMGIAAHI